MEMSTNRVASIVLVLIAVVLTAYSASVPWYRISPHDSGTYSFYCGFSIWDPSQGSSGLSDYGSSPLGRLMWGVLVLTIIWVAVGILVILSLLSKEKLVRLGLGAALVLISLITVSYFSVNIVDSIRAASGSFEETGFFGSNAEWEWGPMGGFYSVFIAFVLQVLAMVLIVIDLREEWTISDMTQA